jgi:hypothetical protein
MAIVEKITNIFKKIGSIRFWFIATVTFIALSIAGYFASSKVVYGGYVEKYKALDPFAKNLISIQDWWVESLLGGCIPMFLVFGIQFFLLNQDKKTKDFLFSILPFIKFLNWFAGKPIIFILGTASLFFGAILFLAIEGDNKYYWAMLIPLTLFFLTFSLRYTAGEIASGTGFSPITYTYHKEIAWGCCILAASCWAFADIYSPFSDLYQLWKELTK